jgi:Apea-like HEPN
VLLGYASHSGGSQLIQDVFSLISSLCEAVFCYTEMLDSSTTEVAINRVLSEIDQILRTGHATQEILTPLSGLKLPEQIDQIDLGNNVLLRRLSADEISKIGSNDISSESRHNISSRFVTTALVIKREVKFLLSERNEELALDGAFNQEFQDQIDAFLHALHILKSGRVGIIASFLTFYPTVLPNMTGLSFTPLIVNPFTFMELTLEEVELFISLHKKIILNRRDEVRIAAARLLDSERRLSPVDSLLDAVIGLEVLLNPNDYAELSFRVALNYAYLGSKAEQRKRYENVRDIQKTRNRIVHGGLNVRSKDATLIHEHAELAKKCLRDCITCFLTDEAFANSTKLDADFWLDRVIPPTL